MCLTDIHFFKGLDIQNSNRWSLEEKGTIKSTNFNFYQNKF